MKSELLQTVQLAELRPHPKNPRGKIAPRDVQDLIGSIRALGLLQPLIVRKIEDGPHREDFEVLSGHRRLVALLQLQSDAPHQYGEIQARVLDVDDAEAAAIMLTDNAQREDLDPFRASDLVLQMVDALKDRPDAVKVVAERLGVTPRWVAQRRALAAVSPAARKLIERGEGDNGPLPHFTLGMLLILAELAPERQADVLEDLAAGYDVQNEKELREHLAREFHKLKDAPWDLDDVTLDPKAGACVGCPKQSQHAPGLFDETGDAGDLKKAVCRDTKCWAAKEVALRGRAIAVAKEKHGKDLVLVEGKGVDYQQAPLPKGSGRALREHEYEPAKKDEKGAKPALVVAGKKQGEITWVKPKRKPAGMSSGGGYSQPKPVTPEVKLELARLKFAMDAAHHEALKLARPSNDVVRGLAAAFLLEERWGRGDDKVEASYAKGVKSDAAFGDLAWEVLANPKRGVLHAEFEQNFWSLDRDAKRRKDLWARLAWLCSVLGLDWKDFVAQAEEKHPAAKLAVAPKGQGKKAAKPKKAKRDRSGEVVDDQAEDLDDVDAEEALAE